MSAHTGTHAGYHIYPARTGFTDTLREEMRALVFYLQMEAHNRTTDLLTVVLYDNRLCCRDEFLIQSCANLFSTYIVKFPLVIRERIKQSGIFRSHFFCFSRIK